MAIGLVFGLVGIGFGNKYDDEMPLVGTNSRAISAACRVLPEDQKIGYVLPIQWGVVKSENGIGDCAFTTAWDVESRDQVDNLYATRYA